MALTECPKCTKQLHPPLKSSERQICMSCGWTNKPQSNEKKENNTQNFNTLRLEQLNLPENLELSAEDTNKKSKQKSFDSKFDKDLPVRKAYQFLQIRVQLLGRGMTNEIMNLYVNGKRLKPKVKTMHEFLNFLGVQGFRIVTAELETEGIYTHFYTMQREIFTQDAITEDIFDTLDKIKEGADFGDSVRNLLEFTTMLDNFY